MAAHKVFIVGAGQPTLEDVLRVVVGQEIAVDAAAAHRIKKDSPAPKAFQTEAAPEDGDPEPADCLDHAQTRAALFFKLQSLINGKSKVRADVVQALASMLNAKVDPLLLIGSVDGVALSALANGLHGVGTAAFKGQVLPIAEALQSAGITPPGLSADERATIQDGQSVSAGTGAICVQAGKALITVATALAALSAEALQADVRIPFVY